VSTLYEPVDTVNETLAPELLSVVSMVAAPLPISVTFFVKPAVS
jgi:hypothetical protein